MLISENQDLELNTAFRPLLYNLSKQKDRTDFLTLKEALPSLKIINQIQGQIDELLKSKHPSVKLQKSDLQKLQVELLEGRHLDEYGIWAYYPWLNSVVHILDEQDFVRVRTNRNQNKITAQEQSILNQKKIGIVGLSVGQSIALTLAMERTCGELRLADFDTAELSNLNRLRTGIHNLGLKKTIIAAREIAEIDPYINVVLFDDGLHKDNMDRFFSEGGNLDLFIEVCDGLDIKIESRFKAKALQIPVVMDTNDRGMLDVERFDLEPNRPILHGFVEGLNPDNIKGLSNEQKIPHILKIVGADAISTRLKASMIEVEQSINTWPQLASSVVLGGALTTDVSRRILLNQFRSSGRYYVDLDQIVGDNNELNPEVSSEYTAPPQLNLHQLLSISSGIPDKLVDTTVLTDETIKEIVSAAILAPSGGNAQPWKFLYQNNLLYIFHDIHYSYSLLDFDNLGSYVAIGAAIENIAIKASAYHLQIHPAYFPLETEPSLVAVIGFTPRQSDDSYSALEKGLSVRLTNRNLGIRTELPPEFFLQLHQSISEYEGAKLHIFDDPATMDALADLLATTEMLRIIHPRGHYDTFTNELRWTPEENAEKRDGLDTRSLGATASEIAALKIAGDPVAISMVREQHGGKAFKKSVIKSVASASAIGIITMPDYAALSFLKGGRAIERIWIEANLKNVAFQPISQLVFLLARLNNGMGDGFDAYYLSQFQLINEKFNKLLPELNGLQPVFIFRLAKADTPEVLSMRRSLDVTFFNQNKQQLG